MTYDTAFSKEYLFQEWLKLLAYSNDKENFNQKDFKKFVDKCAKIYNKLSQSDQGWITEQIYDYYEKI